MFKSENAIINKFLILYFIIGIIEVFSEYYQYKPALYLFKPLIPISLMVLYHFFSKERRIFFYLVFIFSAITNLLFIPSDKQMLFYGILTFTVHRILILVLIFDLLKIKDYFPLFIATIPFMVIFFYILSISEKMPVYECYLLGIHNILISILGGIALSNYIMHLGQNTTWLFICALFFVVLQFIVFIEKFYLNLIIFRPIAMTLNVLAFFSFFKFVYETEKLNNN